MKNKITDDQTKVFILNKFEQIKSLAQELQDPVFFVCAKFMGIKNGKGTVNLTSYFLSDDSAPMKKEQRLVILNYLEKFIQDEKNTL